MNNTNTNNNTAEASLLGHDTRYPTSYDPSLLYPIARQLSRDSLGLVSDKLPFSAGVDVWNAYELSWLDQSGKPAVAMARFHIQASTPNLIESKSFKLYLNSFNSHKFASPNNLVATMRNDLLAALGSDNNGDDDNVLQIELILPEKWGDVSIAVETGECIDDLPLMVLEGQELATIDNADGQTVVQERLFSRLLKSNCPVTGQPDWATVVIEYSGRRPINRAWLLSYIVSFRNHQEFHEACVERIFCQIKAKCQTASLTVTAYYTRRGGLDINPCRTDDDEARVPDFTFRHPRQ